MYSKQSKRVFIVLVEWSAEKGAKKWCGKEARQFFSEQQTVLPHLIAIFFAAVVIVPSWCVDVLCSSCYYKNYCCCSHQKCLSSYQQHCCCMTMRCLSLVRYTVVFPSYHLCTSINWNQLLPQTIYTFAQSPIHRTWWYWKEGMQISAVNASCNMSPCIR